MAPHFTTVLTVARTGSRVVRYLIRPAKRADLRGVQGVSELGHDPWLPQSDVQRQLTRGANLTRRGLGLVTLLVLSVLGAIVMALAVLLLGIGVANGSNIAGWLLGLTLLVGAVGAYWTARRASSLLRAEADVPVPTAAATLQTPEGDEAKLLNLLRTNERALPASTQAAFHATVIATRDALRLTANDSALQRDTYDVRQAVREDLPELLDAYRSVPPSQQSDSQLLEQLRLIEERMQTVKAERLSHRQRALSANGRYLKQKYTPEDGE